MTVLKDTSIIAIIPLQESKPNPPVSDVLPVKKKKKKVNV